MLQRKKMVWALLLTMAITIPSLASASIKRIPPKYLPVANGDRADFALKMNNRLFDWVEDLIEGILNYERCGALGPACPAGDTAEAPDDQYIELEELLNEYVFGPLAVPGSTVTPIVPNPLFAPMCLDIPILGSICLAAFLRDNDVPGDNAVVSFNDPSVVPATPFDIEVEGNSGSVYEIYTDDNLQIEIIVEEIEVDLFLDEPDDAGSVYFDYPNGISAPCSSYIAQQWDGRENDGTDKNNKHCIAAGGETGNIDIDGDTIVDYTLPYGELCQGNDYPTVLGPPADSVWADLGDMLCDYPDPNSATVANGCNLWREAADQWDIPTDSPFANIAACGQGNTTGHNAAACTFYASACDLSNWLSLAADLTIGWDSDIFGVGAQDLHIGIGIRPMFAGNGTRDKANTALGFELQHLDFGTNLVFEINVTIPTDHPQYEWSADIDAILPAIDMAIRVYMEDLFKCGDQGERPPDPTDPNGTYIADYPYDPNCVGYYIGATQLIDLASLLSGFLPFEHPLIPYYKIGGGVLPSALGNALDFNTDLTPWPATADAAPGADPDAVGAGINLDFGIVSDWMAQTTWGAMMPANLYLDVQMVFMDATTSPAEAFVDPDTLKFIPYPSCTYQADGRIGDAQAAAYPGYFAPNPSTFTSDVRLPMFCDPPEVGGARNAACNQDPTPAGDGITDELDVRNSAIAPSSTYYGDNDGGGPLIFDTEIADRYMDDYAGTGETVHFLQGGCNPLLDAGDVPTVGDPNRGPCTGDYMLGIGLHQDVISELVYGLVASGILCLTIDPTVRVEAPSLGNSLLNMFSGTGFLSLSTGNAILAFLLPELPEEFGTDAPIIIKLVPYTIDPRTASTNWTNIPRAWTGGRITEVIDNLSSPATNPNPGTWYTQTQLDPKWFGGTLPAALQGQEEVDITIDIPHLLVEFWTKKCNVLSTCQDALPDRSYDAAQRVFSLDLGFRMGLDIDILSPMPSPTTFPSGASWVPTATARTIFLGLVLDPSVKMLFSYLEIGNAPYDTEPCNANHSSGCGAALDAYQDSPGSAFQDNGYVLANVENYMGNLLTTLLSMIAQLEVRITIDLGARGIGTALPPIPIAVNGAIEPSCNKADEDAGACPRNTDLDLYRDLDPNTAGVQACANAGLCQRSFGIGHGDFLQIYLDVVGSLPTAFIFQILTCALLPNDPTCSGMAFDLSGLGLSPAGTKGKAELLFETPGFAPPETMILPFDNANPFETVIYFKGMDNETPTDMIRYSWRLDGGAWRPFYAIDHAVLRGLADGLHSFEVRAIDTMNYLEPAPAKVQFVVDALGPDIYLEGDELSVVKTDHPIFFARAYDHVYKNDVEMAYRVDGSDWKATDGEIMLSGVSKGSHVLDVRATDPKGNVSVASHSFSAKGDGGYGCSSSPKGGADTALLFLLLLAPVALLRRKANSR